MLAIWVRYNVAVVHFCLHRKSVLLSHTEIILYSYLIDTYLVIPFMSVYK